MSKNPADNLSLVFPKSHAMNADQNIYQHIFSIMRVFILISMF